MQEAALDMTQQAFGEYEDRTPVQFYVGSVENQTKTKEAGRPIFDDVIYMKIFGDKDNIMDQPWRGYGPETQQRFRRQFDAFQAMNADSATMYSGQKLSAWPEMTPSRIKELEYLNIFTVEQLADSPDTTIQQIMGGNELKAKAKNFLELAKDNARFTQIREENETQAQQIFELQQQNASLIAKIDNLTDLLTAQAAPAPVFETFQVAVAETSHTATPGETLTVVSGPKQGGWYKGVREDGSEVNVRESEFTRL